MSGINKGVENVEERLSFLNEEVGRTEDKLKEATTALKVVEDELNIESSSLITKKVEIEELVVKISKLEGNMLVVTEETDELMQERAKALKELEDKHTKFSSDITLIIKELEELEEKKKNGSERFKDDIIINEDLKAENDELVKENTVKAIEGKNLDDSITNKKTMLKEIDEKYNSLTSQLLLIEKEISDKKGARDSKSNTLDVRAKQLDTRENDIFTKEEDLSEKETSINIVLNNIKSRNDEVDAREVVMLEKEEALTSRELEYNLKLKTLIIKEKKFNSKL